METISIDNMENQRLTMEEAREQIESDNHKRYRRIKFWDDLATEIFCCFTFIFIFIIVGFLFFLLGFVLSLGYNLGRDVANRI